MPLTAEKKRVLIASAHGLNPLIIIGNHGVSEGVIAETDRALYDHELIKVRIHAEDKAATTVLATELCTKLDAELLRVIGKIAIIYRRSNKNKGVVKNIGKRKKGPIKGSKSNSGKGKKKPKLKTKK